MGILEDDIAVIESLLGREPRGLEDVAVRDNAGVPVVIRVAPLVNEKPFPTLLWLIDKRLNYAIDQLEAGGLIADLQKTVDSSAELQTEMIVDHQRYIELRQSYFSEIQKQHIRRLGYESVLAERGIGGIVDFQRIRCLHTYYAAHLVRSNTVGRMVDAYWQSTPLTFSHLLSFP
ncbi:MAG: hypothetical protein ACI8VC_000573 [Candidatus Endobugula sp.]|jgi:hypothetical protein